MPVTLMAGALTTLATLKEDLEITDTAQDNRLKRLINAATSRIQKYCSRTFARAAITDERHPLKGGCRLVVDRPPINSTVATMTIEIEDATVAYDSTSYVIEKASAGIVFMKTGLPLVGMARPGIAQNLAPGTELPALLVTYDGGFVTPAQAEEAGGVYEGATVTLPPEIEQACLDLCMFYNSTRGAAGEIASETLGDASISYRNSGTNEDGIPAHVAAPLKPYRRVFLV